MSSFIPKNVPHRPFDLNALGADLHEPEEVTTIAQAPTSHYLAAEQRASELWTIGDNQAWTEAITLPRPAPRQLTRPAALPPVIDEMELQSNPGWSNGSRSQQNVGPQGWSNPQSGFAPVATNSLQANSSSQAGSSTLFTQGSHGSKPAQALPPMPMFYDPEANHIAGPQGGMAVGLQPNPNPYPNARGNWWQRRSTVQKSVIVGVGAAVIIGGAVGGGLAASHKPVPPPVPPVPVAVTSSTSSSTATSTKSATSTTSSSVRASATPNANVLGSGTFLISEGILDSVTSNCSLVSDISCLPTFTQIAGVSWDIVQSGNSYFVNGAEGSSTTVGGLTGAQFSINSFTSVTMSDGCTYEYATLADVFPNGNNVEGVAASAFIGTNDVCSTTFHEQGCTCVFDFTGTRQS